MLAPWKKSYDKSGQHIKKQRHYFANKGPYRQSYGFSSSHAWMWELDHKEGWVPKNWCFGLWCWRRHLNVTWTVRRSNQSILHEISPEYSLEGLMLMLQHFGHLMWSQLIGKDPDARKDWRWEEKVITEDKMFGWHHQLIRHKFEQAPGDERQWRLVCCRPWGCKVLDTSEQLNNNKNIVY